MRLVNRLPPLPFAAATVLCGLFLFCLTPLRCAAQPPNAKTMRLYSSGPLTPADYTSKPADAPAGFVARTDSELRYHADFEYLVGPSGVICQAKRVVVYSILLRKTSWADPSRIEAVLDHEQGHFDITEKNALRAKKSLDAKTSKRQLRALAATHDLAREALGKVLQAEIKPFGELGVAENKAYDEITRHGTLPEAEAEWRARQKAELAELGGAKVKKASTKKEPAPKAKPPATKPPSANTSVNSPAATTKP